MPVEHINPTDSLNTGRVKLNAAIDQSNEAITKSNEAITKATDAEDSVESLRDLVNSGTGERLPYLIDGGYFDDPEEPVGISVDGGDF